ncbi:hypothetical protein FV222_00170 [Methylobacterium sp. WL103]|uniref:hypothetical protein n=1 Tax=Methylobacterium sp. WL103 TaxID=2603891 RepID=UPI0011CA3168|nr:hypothetical protein [Methylobacterium sp. WL103]TXN08921.1 hypothetical protein FV222_00170 [Methylobacterium sp. WL103]
MTVKTIWAVAACLLTMPAQADWQYTRWGMTVDEVVGASKGVARRYTDLGKNGIDWKVLAAGNYIGGPYTFTSIFQFGLKDERLTGVRLEPSNADDCSQIPDSLRVNYGRPMKEDTSGPFKSIVWLSKSGDEVTFMRINSNCHILYEKALNTARGGL